MCGRLLGKFFVASIVVALAGCSSNASAQYAPAPVTGAGSSVVQDAAGPGGVRLIPSALSINDVTGAVQHATVSGLGSGKPISIVTNTCGNNLAALASGDTITVSLHKLFEFNPKGCTIGVDAGGVKLPLAVHVPAISFAALQLPIGSQLSGDSLKLPNTLLSDLITPALRIVEPDYNGAFQFMSTNCYGESILLVQLLQPTIDELNKLDLRPLTNNIVNLQNGAICGVVVSDMAGRSVTLTVQIPSQLP